MMDRTEWLRQLDDWIRRLRAEGDRPAVRTVLDEMNALRTRLATVTARTKKAEEARAEDVKPEDVDISGY